MYIICKIDSSLRLYDQQKLINQTTSSPGATRGATGGPRFGLRGRSRSRQGWLFHGLLLVSSKVFTQLGRYVLSNISI